VGERAGTDRAKLKKDSSEGERRRK